MQQAHMAFLCNALIFLLMGLRLRLSELLKVSSLFILVIAAMLLSRAAVVYGLLPLVRRLRRSEVVGRRYKAVMFWGGLRGAVALAIAMSLPRTAFLPERDLFVHLVMGAVLFTLVVQGLSIQGLMHALGLDEPTLPDRLARAEAGLTAKLESLDRIEGLTEGGFFSASVAERLRASCQMEAESIRCEIARLREGELTREQERAILYLRCFSEERALFTEMFNNGHLSERAFRELSLILSIQIDALREHGRFEPVRRHRLRHFVLERRLHRVLSRVPFFGSLAERLRLSRVARNFEEAWGHHQGGERVLERLSGLAELERIPEAVVAEVRDQYRHWHELAEQQINNVAEQYPEFYTAMQERLGARLVLLTEAHACDVQVELGLLPRGVAEEVRHEIAVRLRSLRGGAVEKLHITPEELLRKVPFFRAIPVAEFTALARSMRPVTVAEGEEIIRQGESGASLYVIVRGVVRVSRHEGEARRDLATLVAGDFFGEMALLREAPRTATVRAVTPCSLYELSRETAAATMARHPAVREALEAADRERAAGLAPARRRS